MSRCFPYPPPWRVRNGARDEAAVAAAATSVAAIEESIKIQKRSENGIRGHDKEKKREKKERRKHEKEKQKEKTGDKNVREKLLSLKEREEEAEKSGVTEEHGQPASLQSTCYLSDGTQSRNKRKRDDSTPTEGKTRNIIRIRLPLRKHEENGVRRDGSCSTSGRSDFSNQQEKITCIPTGKQCSDLNSSQSNIDEEFSPILENVHSASDSKRKEKSVLHDFVATLGTTLNRNDIPTTENLYKSLIEDWVPPPLQFEQDYCGDEWLFAAQRKGVNKQSKVFHDATSNRSSSTWPRAQWLPQADVYALPYTVPF